MENRAKEMSLEAASDLSMRQLVDEVEAYLGLARVLHARGQHPEALDEYTRAFESARKGTLASELYSPYLKQVTELMRSSLRGLIAVASEYLEMN